MAQPESRILVIHIVADTMHEWRAERVEPFGQSVALVNAQLIKSTYSLGALTPITRTPASNSAEAGIAKNVFLLGGNVRVFGNLRTNSPGATASGTGM